MTYDRFKELWTALVTNRTLSPEQEAAPVSASLSNGVSEETVNALVAVADGDHSVFDAIQAKLAAIDRA